MWLHTIQSNQLKLRGKQEGDDLKHDQVNVHPKIYLDSCCKNRDTYVVHDIRLAPSPCKIDIHGEGARRLSRVRMWLTAQIQVQFLINVDNDLDVCKMWGFA
jgi:hypothetical protein